MTMHKVMLQTPLIPAALWLANWRIAAQSAALLMPSDRRLIVYTTDGEWDHFPQEVTVRELVRRPFVVASVPWPADVDEYLVTPAVDHLRAVVRGYRNQLFEEARPVSRIYDQPPIDPWKQETVRRDQEWFWDLFGKMDAALTLWYQHGRRYDGLPVSRDRPKRGREKALWFPPPDELTIRTWLALLFNTFFDMTLTRFQMILRLLGTEGGSNDQMAAAFLRELETAVLPETPFQAALQGSRSVYPS